MLLSAVLAFVCFYLARQRKRAGTEQTQPKKLAKTTEMKQIQTRNRLEARLISLRVKIENWLKTIDWDKLIPRIIAFSLLLIAIALMIIAFKMPAKSPSRPRGYDKYWWR